MHKNEKTDWHKDRQLDKKTKNFKKPSLSVVNAGPSDTEYLYYSLNVESVTQKGPLLPAYIR